MKKLLNIYFDNPVKYDYILTFSLLLVIKKFIFGVSVKIPEYENILDLASETGTILLTAAGFILTFLTVLITIKLDAGNNKNYMPESEMSLLEKFCHSGLYFDTTVIFKNSIKSVVSFSIFIYIIRLISSNLDKSIIFVISVGGIIILVLTIIRCLVILDSILELQKKEETGFKPAEQE